MALSLEQRGSGRALVIFSGPAAPGDTTSAPGLPAAAKAALGPAPWIVSVNARGPEGLQQILGFARVNRADLWLAAVVAFSAGGQKLRQLRLEALKLAEPGPLAWVSVDAMHSEKPPLPLHVQTARDLVAQARVGALTLVLTHTYIQPDTFTSTVEMARLATGWPLAMPPRGTTVARGEGPEAQPAGWQGALAVYSTGSTPADKDAHIWQARVLMPYVLRQHVRGLVELDGRPEVIPVSAAAPSSSSPEATPVVLDLGSPGGTNAAPSPKPPSSTVPASYVPETPSVTPPAAEPHRILLVGDSLAIGLQKPLRERAVKLRVPFASSAQQGTTIRQWLTGKGLTKPLAAVLDGAKPTLTLVSLGTNDMRGNDPAAAGREGGQLVDLLLRNGAGAVGWILPPTMPFAERGFRAALLDELARRTIRSFDSTKLVLTRGGDQIHPDANSYALWANAIADWWPFSLLASGAFPTPSPSASAPPSPPVNPPSSASPAPALVTLLAQIDARWPNRARGTDGILGDAAHQQRLSDHNTGDALDITSDAANGPPLDALAAALLRDPRTHYVIWNRRIANVEIAGGTWRPYTGTSAHTDHLHLSIYPAKRNDASAWNLSAEAPSEPGDVWVAGIGKMRFDPDYVARVVTAENGAARSLEGLKALAVAARTFARGAMLQTPGLGTAVNPLKNGQSFQVCAAGAPAALCMRAAQETLGGLALYRGKLITANHVAGAPWPAGQKHGVGPGLANTERYVTYNEGKHGAAVTPTPIGLATNPQNRGCLSQNGAEALGGAWGYRFGDILRFFYGDDVDLTIAEYHGTPPSTPPAPSDPAPRAPSGPASPPAPREPASPSSSGSDGLVAAGAVALGLAVLGAVT
jgi:lysophospholipase L1-like esterase